MWVTSATDAIRYGGGGVGGNGRRLFDRKRNNDEDDDVAWAHRALTASACDGNTRKHRLRLSSLRPLLCCLALSLSWGNTVRLARQSLSLGFPFMLAYFALLLLAGTPLVLVRSALGQFCGVGSHKAHRAVPLIKGVEFLRCLACWSCCVCVALHAALSTLQFVLSLAGPVPYHHCRLLKMTKDGYMAAGWDGEKCIQETFLAGPLHDPLWYGVLAAITLVIFGFVLLVSRTGPALRRTLLIMSVPLLSLMIATLAVSATVPEADLGGTTTGNGDENTAQEVADTSTNWWILLEAPVWLAALNQLIYSTMLGFGVLPVLNGRVMHKGDSIRASFILLITLALTGALSIAAAFVLQDSNSPRLDALVPQQQNIDATNRSTFTPPLYHDDYNKHSFDETASTRRHRYYYGPDRKSEFSIVAEPGFAPYSTAYDFATGLRETNRMAADGGRQNGDRSEGVSGGTLKVAILALAYGWFGLAALVSMAVLTLTLAQSLRAPWIAVASLLAEVAYLCAAVIPGARPLILAETLAIPAVVVTCLVVETAALVLVYGLARLQSDLEFTTGRPVHRFWFYSSLGSCAAFCAIYVWYAITRSVPEHAGPWGAALASLAVLLVFAAHEVWRQVGYNLIEKFTSACRPTLEWGPGDPVIRHSWKLWTHHGRQNGAHGGIANGGGAHNGGGERDFTLRRKGTKDYTHSVRKKVSEGGVTHYHHQHNKNQTINSDVKNGSLFGGCGDSAIEEDISVHANDNNTCSRYNAQTPIGQEEERASQQVKVLTYDNFGADLDDFLNPPSEHCANDKSRHQRDPNDASYNRHGRSTKYPQSTGYTKSQAHHDLIADINLIRRQSNAADHDRRNANNSEGYGDTRETGVTGNYGAMDYYNGPYVLGQDRAIRDRIMDDDGDARDHTCWRNSDISGGNTGDGKKTKINRDLMTNL